MVKRERVKAHFAGKPAPEVANQPQAMVKAIDSAAIEDIKDMGTGLENARLALEIAGTMGEYRTEQRGIAVFEVWAWAFKRASTSTRTVGRADSSCGRSVLGYPFTPEWLGVSVSCPADDPKGGGQARRESQNAQNGNEAVEKQAHGQSGSRADRHRPRLKLSPRQSQIIPHPDFSFGKGKDIEFRSIVGTIR